MQVTVIGDGGMKQLDELLARTKDLQGVNEVFGRAGANVVKSHFVTLDKVGNAMGGPRTHFYGQAVDATQSVADTGGATISINQIGISLLYHGGTVRPVTMKLLAIPAMPECHGRHPSEFQNLTMRWGRGKEGDIRPVALVEKILGAGAIKVAQGRLKLIQVREGNYKIGKMAGHAIHPRWHSNGKAEADTWPRIFFWLSLEAKIGAHPDVLPEPKEIVAAAQDAGYRYLLRREKMEGGS